MDIEKLKEWANTQNIGTANMSYHKAQEHVLEIINESNQSATSEDVADAINEFSYHSKRAKFLGDGEHVLILITVSSINLALTALQQMRTKPCDKSCPISCDFYNESGTTTKCPVCGKSVTK